MTLYEVESRTQSCPSSHWVGSVTHAGAHSSDSDLFANATETGDGGLEAWLLNLPDTFVDILSFIYLYARILTSLRYKKLSQL